MKLLNIADFDWFAQLKIISVFFLPSLRLMFYLKFASPDIKSLIKRWLLTPS